MRSIYLYIVAATLIFGWLLPQKGSRKKYYILLMTLLHIFVSGFRYYHMTGDLMKYHNTFLILGEAEWLGEDILNGGKNFGFLMYLKLFHHLSGGDFQSVLISIAVIIHLILGYMVYRYSPAPWMSYLAWNCLAFYVFGFSALKQSLAMALVMLSFDGIYRRKPWFFLLCMAFAGAVHMPALVFLPAYPLCRVRLNSGILLLYVFCGAALFLFKEQFVNLIQAFYYPDGKEFTYTGPPGSRFIMILGFSLFSILLTGFDDPALEKLMHLMVIASMLQMLSGFDNVFTRLTDYYFQFSVFYLPLLFFPDTKPKRQHPLQPLFPFNARSRRTLALLLCVFLIWYYHTCYIGITVSYHVDDYTNYRFMWDVNP